MVGRALIALLAVQFIVLTTASGARSASQYTAGGEGSDETQTARITCMGRPSLWTWVPHTQLNPCLFQALLYAEIFVSTRAVSENRLNKRQTREFLWLVSHRSSASQILEADVCKLITWPLNSSKPPKVLHYVSIGLRNRYVLPAN